MIWLVVGVYFVVVALVGVGVWFGFACLWAVPSGGGLGWCGWV